MDAHSYAQATNARPGGEQAATGTPQAAAPFPAAPAESKRPPRQKNDELMATILETAMQGRYYKVQFKGQKPEGSHGKKGMFAGRVPSMETLDRTGGWSRRSTPWTVKLPAQRAAEDRC